MAFNRKQFATVGAGGNACPREHVCKDTATAKSGFETVGYLDAVKGRLRVGDVVTFYGSDGVHKRSISSVTASSAVFVSVADLVMS